MMTIPIGLIRNYYHKYMKQIGHIGLMRLIGLILVLFAIGFNLWVYRLEPTALADPNDNTFQFALVERTNQIWDFANKKCAGFFVSRITCHVSLLVDHWVPNWAEGYNLPYYYSHIPQIIIVASFRFLSLFTSHLPAQAGLSLFTYYHIIIYLLLCFFPLSIFLSLRIIGISWISAGVGSLIASQLSTEGLYGLDPSSFLWRGYGLSSQLFAMIWLPLAIAFAWRGRTIPAILTLAATTAGHLGIGVIAFLSVGIISISHLSNLSTLSDVKQTFKKLFLLYGGVLLLLGYWIVPILLHGNYHNISVWDGIWKFDSFGYREVLKNLFNGDLFDFRRLPILTTLVFIGFFSVLRSNEVTNKRSFALLFIFWLLLYFGRTTWGGLFNLIPGMSEFHLSRFIVGVHITGLFLIPMGLDFFKNKLVLCVLLVPLVLFGILPQTLRYASHNDFLIKRGNIDYNKAKSDTDLLFAKLRSYTASAPGRVFPGRGGSWGKDFKIAETTMFMHLSTYGIPVILWLPETWSPNSDTEQYFSENNPAHYSLYNVRYVATPANLANGEPVKPQPFWKLLESGKSWRLYSVDISDLGYVTVGVRPAIVSTTKNDYRGVVRLWMHSKTLDEHLYPELTFDKNYPKNSGLPNFRMLDEVTYKTPDGSTYNLFSSVPRYISPTSPIPPISLISQSSDHYMIFTATVEVPVGCTECLVILRQTFHPSWKATVDGKPADTLTIFPFYTAIKLDTPGTHEIIFSYEPSTLKIFLLLISIVSVFGIFWFAIRHSPKSR